MIPRLLNSSRLRTFSSYSGRFQRKVLKIVRSQQALVEASVSDANEAIIAETSVAAPERSGRTDCAPTPRTLRRIERLKQSVITVNKTEPIPDYELFEQHGACILIDKAKEWTSFDVVARLRALTGIKRIGHAGTLDPMATGLLIVLIGPATQLQDVYMAEEKEYSGTIKLGEWTPSLDAETAVEETQPWEHVSDAHFSQIRDTQFMGPIKQIPPMYSALKYKGVKLLSLAREGIEVEREAREVEIRRFDLHRDTANEQLLHFYVECTKGTYLRSLADDFTRASGTVGHLVGLRRESIGRFRVSDAFTIDEFVASAGPREKVKSYRPPKLINGGRKNHKSKAESARKAQEERDAAALAQAETQAPV